VAILLEVVQESSPNLDGGPLLLGGGDRGGHSACCVKKGVARDQVLSGQSCCDVSCRWRWNILCDSRRHAQLAAPQK
jgi:hypothetical protein